MTSFPTARMVWNRRTISGTGEWRSAPARHLAGFSLVEMLLVIALIAIMASIFVVNFDVLIRRNESDSLEDAFWRAATEARNLAMFERRVQLLRYDPESRAYLVGTGAQPKRFEVDTSDWSEAAEVEVHFKQRLSDDSYGMVGGRLVTLREIGWVRFFPDGTCMPFILEIFAGEDLRSIEVDPWSGAELLASEDER